MISIAHFAHFVKQRPASPGEARRANEAALARAAKNTNIQTDKSAAFYPNNPKKTRNFKIIIKDY